MCAEKSLAEIAEPDMDWFRHGRLGMFIHWGLYAVAARHEWVKSHERTSDEDYRKYFDNFHPDLYDPREWARAARDAGMKYFVITTKHHEGFCLWDTEQTDYKATNTPWGKDLLQPMVEAFRAEGLRVGFYYSLLDWHHPEFTVEGDTKHPMRACPEFIEKSKGRDHSKYADYMYAQVKELLTEFGKVDYLFFDFSYPGDGPDKGREGWRSERLMRLCRELQPGIIVNDRLDLLDVSGGWDFRTPEQVAARGWVEMDGKRVPWETCQTFSGSWGYHRDEASWKSVKQCIVLLVDTVSKGGNLLMNVGPTARGTFDHRAMDRLRGYGKWMKLHSRSIYGCTAAPEGIKRPENCILTWNPEAKRLYVHVLNWPFKHLHLDGLAGRVKYAQLLNDASEVRMSKPWQDWDKERGEKTGTLTLELPVVQPPVEVPVVELMLE